MVVQIMALLLTAFSVGGFVYVFAISLSESASSYTSTYEKEMTNRLSDLFIFIPASRLVDLSWALASVVFLCLMIPFFNIDRPVLLLGGLVVSGSFATGAFFVPRAVITVLRNRRRDKFNLQLVEALAAMSNVLRAGFSINQAFVSVAKSADNPLAQEFNLFLQHVHVGIPFSDALDVFDTRMQSQDLSLVVSAINVTRKTGGNLTEIFDTIAHTIRERLRIELRIKTLTSQGRLQGWIIGLMPFLLAGGMTLLKPEMMLPFLFSLTGVFTLILVTFLVICGGLIIRKIIKIDI